MEEREREREEKGGSWGVGVDALYSYHSTTCMSLPAVPFSI